MSIWWFLLIDLGIGGIVLFSARLINKEAYQYSLGSENVSLFGLVFLYLIFILFWPYTLYQFIIKGLLKKRQRQNDTTRRQNAMELYSEKEREIDRRVKRGDSFGKDADALVKELMTIGLRDGFLSENPGGNFDAERRHIQARHIGEALYKMGGINLMKAVGYRIAYGCPRPGASRELEYCWDGIGNWRA